MKSVIILIVVLGLLLASCNANPPPTRRAADGFVFQIKQYEKTNFQMQVVVIKNQKEFDKIAKDFFSTRERRPTSVVSQLDGFSRLQHLASGELNCIIYIKDPNWKYEPEIIGHEVAHCIWGEYHDRSPGKLF